jgi:hypothetical protein
VSFNVAVPTLRRKDTNKLLSDKCVSWSGWRTPWGMAEIPTITGVPYLQRTGVMTLRCTATFRFRSSTPTSTIDNYFELMEYARNLGILLFRDLEGFVSEVQVSSPPGESETLAVQGPKTQTVYEVPLELLRRGYVG